WEKVLATGAVQSVDEGNQARDEFMAGTSAMTFASNNVLESMVTAAADRGFDLGVTELPKVNATDKGGVCPGGSSIYVLDRKDEQKVAKAWKFVKQWVSAEYQTEWALGTGCIPVNLKAMDTSDMKAYTEKRPQFFVAFNAMMNSNPKVQEHLAPTQQAFTTIFKDNGSKFVAGQMTIDECVTAMATECNAALDEYNRANPVN
ncbi:MAG: extracellular solute-binding protein, partial [Hungatella sp.]